MKGGISQAILMFKILSVVPSPSADVSEEAFNSFNFRTDTVAMFCLLPAQYE